MPGRLARRAGLSAQSPTLVNGPAPGIPAGATAAVFDGSQNQYVNITGGGGLNGLTTGTIGMWVNWTSSGQQAGAGGAVYGAVLGRQSSGAFSSDLIGLDGSDPSSSHIVFWGASSDPTRLTSNTSPGVDQWHYLSIVFSSSSQQLYLDGTLDATLNNGLGAVGNDPSVPLSIGAWIGDGNSYSNSMVRDVGVWDTALPASAIQTLADGNPPEGAVPEPSTVVTMGLMSMGLLRRRRATAAPDSM